MPKGHAVTAGKGKKAPVKATGRPAAVTAPKPSKAAQHVAAESDGESDAPEDEDHELSFLKERIEQQMTADAGQPKPKQSVGAKQPAAPAAPTAASASGTEASNCSGLH